MGTVFYCDCGMRVEFSSDNVTKDCLDDCPYCKKALWRKSKCY